MHTCFHKNAKMQKCKGASAEHQAGLAVMPSDAAFRWLNIKMQNMSTKASLHDLCRLTKHLNFFLHPSWCMAWKKLRHGVAENFSSPRKKIRHSSPNPFVPIKFYKYEKIILFLFCNNKIKLYLCSGIPTTKQPLAVSHWPLAKQRNTNQKQNIKHNAQIKSAQRQIWHTKTRRLKRREAEGE